MSLKARITEDMKSAMKAKETAKLAAQLKQSPQAMDEAVAGHATRIDGQDTDLTLTPDTLASLVFGRYSATEAAAAGLLENIRNADALARWNEILRLAHPPHEAEHTW